MFEKKPARLYGQMSHKHIMNESLSGDVPANLKLKTNFNIKKPNLDTSVLSNFMPIFKLPFLSKVFRKIN